MTTTQRRVRRRRASKHAAKRGAPPGSAVYTGDVAEDVPVDVQIIDYDPSGSRQTEAVAAGALTAFAEDNTVTWINLTGIHKVDAVKAVCETFGVHPLWVEDIVNPASRSKTDMLDDRVLVIARMVHMDSDALLSEQVSMVLGKGWVLTFQERPGDVWDSLRTRISIGNGRVRRMNSDYLLHALLDGIVDHYFLALEKLEGRVDGLEALAIDGDKGLDLGVIFELKNELAEFRRIVWPMRESISGLLRMEDGPIGTVVAPYFRDLYDHLVQVMDILETSRERVVGVYELHLAVTSHRLNDIMKLLTIVSTIFIPMTFIAGVYGMNFQYIPELGWSYGYLYVWALMLGTALVGALVVISRRWLA